MKKEGSVLFLVLGLSILSLSWSSDGYTPPDSYLIDCGSSANATVEGRVFVTDNQASKFLSTPQDILASTSGSGDSSDVSQLYRTARIYTGTTTYSFSISQIGRHWICELRLSGQHEPG
ncbi:hypothetical protein MLD38_003544 [Melastoma candidum]|uniref:Uncharacterized protein n=1 Tax=Melastoma candidum TaxID=119954 RepID=A0ACB9S2E5_9MYRT|nr:hypothetical protein MLD38_003544 [Melastoma candidum]